MRIQLYQNGVPQKWVNDEYVDVANNADLAEKLKEMIRAFSLTHGDQSLLDGDVQIVVTKEDRNASWP